jgi:penicillin-binding protein 1B
MSEGNRLRVRISRGFLTSRLGLALCGTLVLFILCGAGFVLYRWVTYGRMIDERLAGHRRETTARIYAAPARIFNEQALTAPQLVNALQRAGYGPSNAEGAPGYYSVRGAAVEIHPQQASYFAGKNALRVEFAGNQVRAIRSLDDQSTLDSAEIEPELLTNIFDSSREKRRQVAFNDIPPILMDAVLSAEDKRFFEHPGFDFIRIFGAAWADLRGDRLQGASTLTMQVARSFFFSTERTWGRKLDETMVALELERRFNKQKIFELYANEIYLGNRGSFAIHGFAEGSLAYFNKDIRNLSLGEAAFLAGIIRAPNRYSAAERWPERAVEARDRVLAQMVENHYVTMDQARDAKRAPLHIVSGGLENSDAPYFVDMVDDHLLDHFSQADLLSGGFRVYTTLDPQLERAATDAVAIGVANLDQQLARRYARFEKQGQPARVQVAFVALDPHTGEIRAVIGGRNYGESQLNRALARRQPGSVFKPFVYAAAFSNAVQGISPVVTPATTVMDEPTAFDFDNQEYTPNNYGQEFRGNVTLRDALTFSLNVATVKVAEMIGYGRVVDVARQMGVENNLQATPALALGAYEMTPMDVAAAYTAFANGGTRVEPMFIDRVVGSQGAELERNITRSRRALDPRVAYQVTSILEDVIDHGTGEAVRARGFTGPAAGKTGTSRDGWFAGYTSNLLCIVWVGFDDNRDLELSGASSAAPIWAEFMKRATALPAYRNLQDFAPPDGVTVVDIDPDTLQLATPACPVKRQEVFISGTEPTEFCEKHGGRIFSQRTQVPSWLSRLFGGQPKGDGNSNADESSSGSSPDDPSAKASSSRNEAAPDDANSEEKKPGLLQRVFGGIFRGKKDQDNSNGSSPDPER